MMIMTRRLSPPILAGLAFGTLLVASCASVAKNEPPAFAPTVSSSSPVIWEPAVLPAVASGDELEPRGAAAITRERESAIAQRLTMKGFKPIDWSKATSEGGGGSAVSGAVAAGAPVVPAVFAERRASEALDRLAGLVTIRHEKRGAVITLSSDKLVDSGQWAITPSGQYSLRELAAGLRDQDGRTIFVQGYTDSMGTSAVNDAVSLRRAEAVRDYLITQGVAAEKLRAEGLGAKRPVAANGTPDGRAQNRRIEIVIAPAP
jgi:outer membrane protein OmpA-like peptidoglycan-associated protein